MRHASSCVVSNSELFLVLVPGKIVLACHVVLRYSSFGEQGELGQQQYIGGGLELKDNWSDNGTLRQQHRRVDHVLDLFAATDL